MESYGTGRRVAGQPVMPARPWFKGGGAGWIVIGALVVSWDLIAPETLSAAFRRPDLAQSAQRPPWWRGRALRVISFRSFPTALIHLPHCSLRLRRQSSAQLARPATDTAQRLTGWIAPGTLEALIPGRMQGHGSTAEFIDARVADYLRPDLALDALEMALWVRRDEELGRLVHHSDRTGSTHVTRIITSIPQTQRSPDSPGEPGGSRSCVVSASGSVVSTLPDRHGSDGHDGYHRRERGDQRVIVLSDPLPSRDRRSRVTGRGPERPVHTVHPVSGLQRFTARKRRRGQYPVPLILTRHTVDLRPSAGAAVSAALLPRDGHLVHLISRQARDGGDQGQNPLAVRAKHRHHDDSSKHGEGQLWRSPHLRAFRVVAGQMSSHRTVWMNWWPGIGVSLVWQVPRLMMSPRSRDTDRGTLGRQRSAIDHAIRNSTGPVATSPSA